MHNKSQRWELKKQLLSTSSRWDALLCFLRRPACFLSFQLELREKAYMHHKNNIQGFSFKLSEQTIWLFFTSKEMKSLTSVTFTLHLDDTYQAQHLAPPLLEHVSVHQKSLVAFYLYLFRVHWIFLTENDVLQCHHYQSNQIELYCKRYYNRERERRTIYKRRCNLVVVVLNSQRNHQKIEAKIVVYYQESTKVQRHSQPFVTLTSK